LLPTCCMVSSLHASILLSRRSREGISLWGSHVGETERKEDRCEVDTKSAILASMLECNQNIKVTFD
jgi:hypothetical protein